MYIFNREINGADMAIERQYDLYGVKPARHWCDGCKAFVVPILGVFFHPHIGQTRGIVCPRDNHLVYLREDKPREVA